VNLRTADKGLLLARVVWLAAGMEQRVLRRLARWANYYAGESMSKQHNPDVRLVGEIVGDVRRNQTSNGTHVCNFRVACEKEYEYQGGVRQSKGSFWCCAFGRCAETLANATEGTVITASADLQNSSYENKEGEKVWKTELKLYDVQLDSSADPAPAAQKELGDDLPF
jgi:single-strand DNA-binding protein